MAKQASKPEGVTMAHTPGPWEYGKLSEKIIGPRGTLIALMRGSEKDGALIAAAPDMLAALEACIESGQLTALTPNVIRTARAAIVKAIGKE